MTGRTPSNKFECPAVEIAAYIDGELDTVHELELEAHLDVCSTCSDELTLQKQFLCGLNSSLMHEGDLELPSDFTKRIVANAESTVTGLRRPRERYNAVFICVALGLFVLFALGGEASQVLSGYTGFFEQVAIVGSFFGHLVYSVFVGLAIILRALASQFQYDHVAIVILVAFVFGMFLLVSGRMLRTGRA